VDRSLVANDSSPRAPIAADFSFENAQAMTTYRTEIRRVSKTLPLSRIKETDVILDGSGPLTD
jgi:hypothetical protein